MTAKGTVKYSEQGFNCVARITSILPIVHILVTYTTTISVYFCTSNSQLDATDVPEMIFLCYTF